MYRDTTSSANSANTSNARGTGRAALWPPTRVLLSPIQFRERQQPYNSPSTTASSDEYEDEEDEEDFYTPGSAASLDMNVYSLATIAATAI
jgi:hypothetical protein